MLSDRAFRFAAQLAMPDVFTFDVHDDRTRSTYLQHVDGSSWARVEVDCDAYNVVQGGLRRLWDKPE